MAGHPGYISRRSPVHVRPPGVQAAQTGLCGGARGERKRSGETVAGGALSDLKTVPRD